MPSAPANQHAGPARVATPRSLRRRELATRVASSGVLGVMSWVLIQQLGLLAAAALPESIVSPLWILGSVALGVTGRQRVLWWVCAPLTLLYLLVAHTPLTRWCLTQIEPPSFKSLQSDAVVALSADAFESGEPTDQGRIRQLKALELLRAGVAPVLVITRLKAPKPSQIAATHRQMLALGLEYPIIETGPIGSTRDEAREAARLARTLGWKQVCIVSDATHLKRAVMLFRHEGLETVAVACAPRRYEWLSLDQPQQRLEAFRDWMWESVRLLAAAGTGASKPMSRGDKN